jgi:RNA polymerase sigma factor (sigma-70 family)
MEDREVVAAIVAGDPSGLAAAYDRYAAGLYGYCRWMLRDPAAAEAVRQTFAVAAAELGGLPDGVGLRPWLYLAAREECYHRLRTDGAGPDFLAEGPDEAERAELRALILAALAGLKPYEREVIELSMRHGLDDAELSAVLGVSWSRAHALVSHARGQMERALAALLIARTGRKDCPALDRLLADWDGQLTPRLAELAARHVEQCPACAGHKHGGLRPEVLSELLPLAPLPDWLREQVLRQHALWQHALRQQVPAPQVPAPQVPAPAPQVPAPAPQVPVLPGAGGAKSASPEPDPAPRRARRGAPRLLGSLGWSRMRGNPGAATAATAVVVWVAAAASVTLLTLTGTHAVRAMAAQSHPGTSASAPAAASSGTSAGSGTGKKRPSGRHRPRHRPSQEASALPQLAPSVTVSPSKTVEPTASHSASPSRSSSPSPSQSSSASSSPSPSGTPTRSPSPSPSPSASPSPPAP